jgi:hypothetical protein
LIRAPNTDVSPSSVNLDLRLSLNTDVSPSSEVSNLVSSYLFSCGLGDIFVVSQELVGFISYSSVQVSRSPKLFSSVKDLVQLAVRSSTTSRL